MLAAIFAAVTARAFSPLRIGGFVRNPLNKGNWVFLFQYVAFPLVWLLGINESHQN